MSSVWKKYIVSFLGKLNKLHIYFCFFCLPLRLKTNSLYPLCNSRPQLPWTVAGHSSCGRYMFKLAIKCPRVQEIWGWYSWFSTSFSQGQWDVPIKRSEKLRYVEFFSAVPRRVRGGGWLEVVFSGTREASLRRSMFTRDSPWKITLIDLWNFHATKLKVNQQKISVIRFWVVVAVSFFSNSEPKKSR